LNVIINRDLFIRVEVRLSEHDLTKTEDCDDEDPTDCVTAVDYEIEKIIKHENYTKIKKDFLNDIALIRLKKAIEFTVDVAPICLPITAKNALNLAADRFLTTMGFGMTENETYSDVMLKTNVPFVDHKECKEILKSKFKFNVNDGQLCAGGHPNRTDS